MRRYLWVAAFVLAANLALASQQVTLFNGVAYRFPAAPGAGLLSVSDDTTNTLAWAAGPELSEWPPDLVVASPTGSCPTGWTEFTELRGRAPVGLPLSGTNGANVGTALTDVENRAVGTHGHAVTDDGHNHTQQAHAHTVSGSHVHGTWATTTFGFSGISGVNHTEAAGTTSTSTSTTGVTIDNATGTNSSATTGATVNNTATVAGTNAPYTQLMYCRTPAA